MKTKISKKLFSLILALCLLAPSDAFSVDMTTAKPRMNNLQPASRFSRFSPRIIPVGLQFVITEDRIKEGSKPGLYGFDDDVSFYYVSMLIGDALVLNIGDLTLRDLIKGNLRHIDFNRFDLDGMQKEGGSFIIPYKSSSQIKDIVIRYSLLRTGQDIPSSAVEMETRGGVKFIAEMLQVRDLNRPMPGDISIEEGQRLIREGFDYDNAGQLKQVFEAVRSGGFNVTWPEFKQKIEGLKKFDSQYPGYFNSLFGKEKRLKPFEISSKGIREIDAASIDRKVLKRSSDEMLEIKNRFDSLAWIDSEFHGDRTINIEKIYSGMAADMAEKAGKQKLPAVISEAAMRDLVANPANARSLYKAVFKLARSRFSEHDRQLRDKYADLAFSAVIADALSDRALAEDLSSEDAEIQAVAFKNLINSYVDHVPVNTGMQSLRSDKLLDIRLNKLSGDVIKALAGVSAVVKKEKDTIRFAPAGFLSVFRGRAGMSDCSFDDEMTSPYARAMHEDMLYYLVYKGGELKGYVGMCIGRALSGSANGKDVLTIDTINSPVLDGQELLMNILARLWKESRDMGLAGIALPSRRLSTISVSFNFDNARTLWDMPIYREARRFKVRTLHDESWNRFNEFYGGHDMFNSIEYGEVDMLSNDALKAIIENDASPAMTSSMTDIARQADMGALLADRIKLAANSAKKDQKSLIIAIETNGWVPDEQKGLVQSLMAEIGSLEKKLKDLGLNNISIVRGTGEELAVLIDRERSVRRAAPKDVIVLASDATINSKAFSYYRSAGVEDGPFLAAIDPVNLKRANYVRLLEMLLITIKLASGAAVTPQDHPEIVIESSGRRMIRLIPRAEPMDYGDLRNIYESQKRALAAA